jgi:hypothetical protein
VKPHEFGIHDNLDSGLSDHIAAISDHKLDFINSFMDSNPQYNKYYLMLRGMREDVAKEQYKKGHGLK